MVYQATVYKVMIASPGDVDAARGIVRRVIYDWNTVNSEDKRIVLMPVSWETHSVPSMDARPQEVINRQILEDADLLVGVFWTRLGTPTGEASSGTVEEIEKHIKAGKPAMIYFSSEPVRLESVDREQWQALTKFKEDYMSRGLIETFDDLQDFERKFSRQLALKILESFADVDMADEGETFTTIRTDSPISRLSEESKTLLLEAAKDARGIIMRVRTMGGLTIQTNGVNFVDQGNPRSEALWKRAIDQLDSEGLITDRGYKGEVYQLTADGYEIADSLSTA